MPMVEAGDDVKARYSELDKVVEHMLHLPSGHLADIDDDVDADAKAAEASLLDDDNDDDPGSASDDEGVAAEAPSDKTPPHVVPVTKEEEAAYYDSLNVSLVTIEYPSLQWVVVRKGTSDNFGTVNQLNGGARLKAQCSLAHRPDVKSGQCCCFLQVPSEDEQTRVKMDLVGWLASGIRGRENSKAHADGAASLRSAYSAAAAAAKGR